MAFRPAVWRRALCALCAALPCFIPHPAAADERFVIDLAAHAALSRQDAARLAMSELEDWLDRQSPWGRRTAPPRVVFVSRRRMTELAGRPARGMGPARGLYDPQHATIYLPSGWDAQVPMDLSVLLHELVHHRQAPHHFFCPAAQEEAAYRLQERWLADRGVTLEVNWIAVVLASGCTRTDFHPD